MIKKIGMIGGRHLMPVDYFLFDEREIQFPLDLQEYQDLAQSRLANIFHKTKGKPTIHLYTTGLTPILLATINATRLLDYKVIVFHHDRESDKYFSQELER